MWGSVIHREMASRSELSMISSVEKLLLTRVAIPPLDLMQESLFFLNMLKWYRTGLLLLLKLVSCRHIIIGLRSFIMSWNSLSLLKYPLIFHWMMLLFIYVIIIDDLGVLWTFWLVDDEWVDFLDVIWRRETLEEQVSKSCESGLHITIRYHRPDVFGYIDDRWDVGVHIFT